MSADKDNSSLSSKMSEVVVAKVGNPEVLLENISDCTVALAPH